MVGKIVIAECEWWKFSFPRLLILLILTPTILTENCSELQANSEAILKNIHDYAYSLRGQWELRENNTRVLLKNLSDYIISGIVNYRDQMDKIYNAVDLTGVDFVNMECHCERKGFFDGQRSEYSKVNGEGEQPAIHGIINPSTCNSTTCYGESTPPDSSEFRKPQAIDISEKAKLDSLVNECIMAVRNNDYDKATSALNRMNDDNSIYTVVNSIYEQDAVSAFTILINLSDKLTNVRRIFLLYNAIHNEMEIRRDNDGFKYLILLEHLNRDVLQQKHMNEAMKKDALNLRKIIRTKIIQFGTDFLRSVYVFKNSTAIKSGNGLLNKTYYLDESLFEEIHQEFLILMQLTGMYTQTFNSILKLTKSRHRPEQELLLHVINFLVRKNYDEIDTNKLSELFKEYLNIVQGLRGKVNEEKIQKYSEKLKTTMSLSLYNMLSSEKLCIKNVGLGTYLNIGGGNENFYKFNDTMPKYYVYLSEKCSPDGYGIWKFEHINYEIYYWKSLNYGQYVEPGSVINDRRITWMWEVTKKDTWCHWRIELTGDYVYIKNDNSNEYLYGSSRTGDAPKDWHKGHTYTLMDGTNICPNQECVWLIEDCSNTVE